MEHYKIIESLGAGSYGEAKLVWNTEDKIHEVIKFIPKHKLHDGFESEFMNHMKLNSPYVIGLHHAFMTKEHLCIVMEYGDMGDLFEVVQTSGYLYERDARYLFQQLILAAKHCHSQGVYHRDIKLENILLSEIEGFPMVKLCDFGYSENKLQIHAKRVVGTPSYLAPEVYANAYEDLEKVDVWACGVCLYVMLTGQYPFVDLHDSKNLQSTVKNILQGKMNPVPNLGLSNSCINLIHMILNPDPAKRLDIKTIMQHEWFQTDFERNQNRIQKDTARDNIDVLHQVADIVTYC